MSYDTQADDTLFVHVSPPLVTHLVNLIEDLSSRNISPPLLWREH